MSDDYREPTPEELSMTEGLVGAQIEIYWDGDLVYYPCKVSRYDAATNKFWVLYENDESGAEYEEDLANSKWRIWAGTEEEFNANKIIKRETLERSCKTDDIKYAEAPKAPTKTSNISKASYSTMVVEAVANLADRHGTSLNAIRKYVQANYELKKQQAASFNALTLKAVNKAVAMNELERVKQNTFRLSNAERERRKERERRLQGGGAGDSLFPADRKKSGRPGSESDADYYFLPFYGTAAANNKSLRKELINMRNKRDKFMERRMSILKPFLPAKNYFTRKEHQLQEKKKKEKEAKALLMVQQQQQASAAAQAAAAIYAATGTYPGSTYNPYSQYYPTSAPAGSISSSSGSSGLSGVLSSGAGAPSALGAPTAPFPSLASSTYPSYTSYPIYSLPNSSLPYSSSALSDSSSSSSAGAATSSLSYGLSAPGYSVGNYPQSYSTAPGVTGLPPLYTSAASSSGTSFATAPFSASTADTSSMPMFTAPTTSFPISSYPAYSGYSVPVSMDSTSSYPYAAANVLAPSAAGAYSYAPSVSVPGAAPVYPPVMPSSFPSLPSSVAAPAAPPVVQSTAEAAAAAADEGVVSESEEVPAEMDETEVAQAKLLEDDGEADFDDSKMLYSTLAGVPIVQQPSILVADLHDHQIQGISWMVHMFQQGVPMILGDQMGLGKTIQSIGFLAYLHHTLHKKGPHLIVVPLSVLSNWISEIEKFCPSFRAVRFHGPKPERDRIKAEELSDLNEFDILVTTYEILVSECNYFKRKYIWTTVIVDEGHRLKNDKSQLSDKLRQVPCLCRVILSGTPLQNNLRELWAMLYYLVPDIFVNSAPLFEVGFDLGKGLINNVVLRKARKLLSVFMLRRLKENVAIKLPSRKEVTILVPLTQNQVDLYKQLLSDGLDGNMIESVMAASENVSSSNNRSTASLNKLAVAAEESQTSTGGSGAAAASSGPTVTTTDNEYRKLMNLLLQLRKICNHTFLLSGSPLTNEVITDEEQPIDKEALEARYREELVQGSGKLQMLDRMLPLLQTDGHRVLLFSQFTSMLDILEEYCERRNYAYVRLDGETNRVKRRLDCRRFNAPNSNLFIFLISTRAGGLGLNLASADTVILYDSDWNPQVDLQAMERAHRIGQTKPVRVYRLICRGSVEERMIYRAEKKLFLNAMVAETVNEETEDEGGSGAEQRENEAALSIGGTNMSKGELASLIRFGANCVFDKRGEGSGIDDLANTISDADLADLLERQGRDKPPPAPAVPVQVTSEGGSEGQGPPQVASADNAANSAGSSSVSIFDRQQATIRDRMENMEEVDIRQLGSVVYKRNNLAKAVEKDGVVIGDSALMTTKRVSKQRVVMVDGKGTGYGGAVPVLLDTMEKESDAAAGDAEDAGVRRGRLWDHQHFCTLCGRFDYLPPAPAVEDPPVSSKSHTGRSRKAAKAKVPPPPPTLRPSPLIRCAHCPWAFHNECMIEYGVYNVTRGGGTTNMFICPHHKCVSCCRATAAAGGLLFRCIGCLTSYCEDCLPEDEIESIGRYKALEAATDYVSRQSYYIKCPSCCFIDNGPKPKASKAAGSAAASVPNDTASVAPSTLDAEGGSVAPPNAGSSSTSASAAAAITTAASSSAIKKRQSVQSLASIASDGQPLTVVDEEEVEEVGLALSEGLAEAAAAAADGEGNTEGAEDIDEDEEDDQVVVPVTTQLMRIHMNEIPPPPPPSPVPEKASKKKAKGKSSGGGGSSSSSSKGNNKRKGSAGEDSRSGKKSKKTASASAAEESEEGEDSDNDGEDEEEESDEQTTVPLTEETYDLSAALSLATSIPAVKEWMEELGEDDKELAGALANIYSKIEKGRYRSGANFIADVKHIIENILVKAANKDLKGPEKTANQKLSNEVVAFLKSKVESRIVIA